MRARGWRGRAATAHAVRTCSASAGVAAALGARAELLEQTEPGRLRDGETFLLGSTGRNDTIGRDFCEDLNAIIGP
jgi:hypothetical protein